MSSSNSKQRTLASRLTFWNAIIYIAFFGSAFSLFYLSINTILYSNLDEDLDDDIAEFRALLDSEGLDAVKNEISREVLEDGPDNIFFRIIKPDGSTLFASDLSGWSELPDSLSESAADTGADSVLLNTITAPDDDYSARVISGRIAPDMILQIGESVEEIMDFMELLLIIFLVTFSVVVVFASVSGWLLARHALRGVEEVSKAASEVSSGTLDRRVHVRTRGAEIERLVSTFNAMLDRIHTLISSMREMTDNVAHDLRSPLGRIRANTEMALSSAESLDEFRSSAIDTLEDCDRLINMINTTLDVAEAEAGITQMKIETVNLSRVAEDACDLYEPIAEDSGVELAASIEPGCTVRGNLQLLQRMLSNLIDNAVKYSERDTRIRVGVKTASERVHISIRDEGIGITEQDMKKIFDRFFRGDDSRSREGCGLGLSLVRAVTIAHGGDIKVTSTLGNGSEFIIVLPA